MSSKYVFSKKGEDFVNFFHFYFVCVKENCSIIIIFCRISFTIFHHILCSVLVESPLRNIVIVIILMRKFPPKRRINTQKIREYFLKLNYERGWNENVTMWDSLLMTKCYKFYTLWLFKWCKVNPSRVNNEEFLLNYHHRNHSSFSLVSKQTLLF